MEPKKKTLLALALYLVAVVVFGALLAPLVAGVGHWAVTQWPWLPWKAATPFPRYFDRAVLIVALAGLWPLIRAVESLPRSEAGLGPNPAFGKQLLLGGGIAVGSSLVLLTMAFATPLNPLQSFPAANLGEWVHSVLPKGILRAPLVAVIEEFFFRGILLALLLRCASPGVALFANSLLFSAVHFLKKAQVPKDFELHWDSGFALLPRCLTAFSQPGVVAPHFVNLALVGLILGWAFWKTRSLVMPIGLHGGWVLMTAGTITLGWPATPVLLATFGLVVWLTKSVGKPS